MPPADRPSAHAGGPVEPGPPGRTVVWTAGSDPEDVRAPHPLRRWLALLVVVGACSFVLAYAVHSLLGGSAPAGPSGSLWLPDRLAPDACSGS